MPCVNSVAPVAMMMNDGDHVGEDRAGDRLAFLVWQLVLAHAALDHRRLQVELHVRGDRRAGGGDQQQQEGGVGVQLGHDERFADRAPVRVREDRRDRVGEERDREPDEDALGRAVGAAHDDQPDPDRRDRAPTPARARPRGRARRRCRRSPRCRCRGSRSARRSWRAPTSGSRTPRARARPGPCR